MRWVPPRESLRRDLLVAAVALVGGTVLAVLDTFPVFRASAPVPYAFYLVPMVCAASGLVLRRRAPLVCLGVGSAAVVADVALGGSLATMLIFTQVLYDTSVHGPPAAWRWLLRCSLALISAGMVVTLLITADWRPAAWLGVLGVLLLLFPTVTGLSVRQYRDQARAERERAEQTARLAELDRRESVTLERHRLARELHDVVANHLSAVAIHATAAQAAFGTDEATVRQALAVIRDSGVHGLDEMRRMIRLLRDPDRPDDAISLLRLAEADRLVDAAAQAGLPVRMSVDGTPRPLPAEVDLAGYRILQESLTNALKHGSGRPTQVAVAYRPGEVVVTVENPIPPVAAAGGGVPGSGAGLLGMQERAALLRGAVTAGPVNGCWRVRAALPTEESVSDGLARAAPA